MDPFFAQQPWKNEISKWLVQKQNQTNKDPTEQQQNMEIP